MNRRRTFLSMCASAAAVAVVCWAISSPGGLRAVRTLWEDTWRALAAKARPVSAPDRALAFFSAGIIKDGTRDYAGAIASFKRAAALEPRLARIHTRLAIDYINIGQQERAFRELKTARDIAPEDPEPRLITAFLLASDMKLDEAAKEYASVLRSRPDDLTAIGSLADVYILQDKMKEASDLYEKLIKKDKTSGLLRFNLGIIYAHLGRFSDAVRALEEAERLSPGRPEPSAVLASLYQSVGDVEGAIDCYVRAVGLDPRNVKLRMALIDAYRYEKRYDEAIACCADGVAVSGAEPALYTLWADTYLAIDRPGEARKTIDEAFGRGIMDDPGLLVESGVVNEALDRDRAALRDYERALEVKRDYAPAFYYRGELYDKMGKPDKAAGDMRQALRVDPFFADAYNYLGYMMLEEGRNPDEAKALIERAVSLEPDEGAFVDSLGWAYYVKGEYREAVRLLERASALEPEEATIAAHLGMALEKAGFADKAAVAFERARRLGWDGSSTEEDAHRAKP